MPDASSFLELFQAGRAEQIINRPELQVAEGDISEMLMYAMAAMADKCIEFSAANFKATFLDGASGDELTQLVNDHWALDRQDAVAATGNVTFTRPTATAGAGNVPTGTTVATQANENGESFRYVTNADLVFGPADLSGSVAATAEATGPESNAAIDKVTRKVDNLFDATLTVSNVAAFAGGADEETDAALRDRVRNFFATLSRGTLDALVFGAKSIAGISVVGGEVSTGGVVTIYVADVDGNSTAQMVNDAQEELDQNWKCFGTVLAVVGGSQVLQDVTYQVTLEDNVSFAELEPLIAAAITAELKKLQPAQTLFVSRLCAAILNVDLTNITNVVVSLPAGDVVAPTSSGQVLRAGTIVGTEA